MGRKRTRQWLLERRVLRSTVGQWIADKLYAPPTEWEVYATYDTVAEVRANRAFVAEMDEVPSNLILSGAEYRTRRVDRVLPE